MCFFYLHRPDTAKGRGDGIMGDPTNIVEVSLPDTQLPWLVNGTLAIIFWLARDEQSLRKDSRIYSYARHDML